MSNDTGKVLYRGDWEKLDESNSDYRGALLSVNGTQCTVTAYDDLEQLSEAYKKQIADRSVSGYQILK
jgi:glutathione peroxidase-family protein